MSGLNSLRPRFIGIASRSVASCSLSSPTVIADGISPVARLDLVTEQPRKHDNTENSNDEKSVTKTHFAAPFPVTNLAMVRVKVKHLSNYE